MYFATTKKKPIKQINQNTSTHPSIYKAPIIKAKIKSADMIEAIIKSNFLFKRKLITLPFIRVFITIVAPIIKIITSASVNGVIKILIVKVSI